MVLPTNHTRVARKTLRCQFLKSTLQYESHLLRISVDYPQKSSAICPAFSFHFLASMLCVPAACASPSICFRSHTGTAARCDGVQSPMCPASTGTYQSIVVVAHIWFVADRMTSPIMAEYPKPCSTWLAAGSLVES